MWNMKILEVLSLHKLCSFRVVCTVIVIIIFVQIFLAFTFFSWHDLQTYGILSETNDENCIECGDGENVTFGQEGSLFAENNGVRNDVKHGTCFVKSREALSAISRAKLQHCKHLLANISCGVDAGIIFPSSLLHSCPSGGLEKGRYVGCFKLENCRPPPHRAYYNMSNTGSLEDCINRCLQSGFHYSGVRPFYNGECFCSNERPDKADQAWNSSCSAYDDECSDYFSLKIFETGISRFSASPANTASSVRREISSVRIVYLLTLNGRSVRQVLRLIKALYHPNHFFYIHIDERQHYLFRELLPLERMLHNVRLSKRRWSTIWGGSSLLTMLLESMDDLIQLPLDWDFVINLSESDYPIKTNAELVSFLSANMNKNFVKSHGRDVQHFIQKQGLDKTFVQCENRMWRLNDRTLPSGIVIDGGSDWFCLSRNFVNYLVTSKHDPLLEGLKNVFKYTLLPAESFFHIVLRNTRFCNTYVDSNLRVTNWKRKRGCKCQYRHVVDWCGCSPNAFTSDDWHRIQNTKEKSVFFARKFEPVICQSVLNKLEKWLYGSAQELTNERSYWQNLYHYEDSSSQTDSALLTLGSSLARISSKHVNEELTECSITGVPKVMQIHTYQKDDKQMGILIEYQNFLSDTKNAPIQFESWFNISVDFNVLDTNSELGKRLLWMTVTSDYDSKEQISRNFANSLGPFSEIVLLYHTTSGLSQQNVTLVWLDPTNTIADIFNITIEQNPVVDSVKPVLRTPLLPGIWTVVCISDGKIISEVKYLISPLEYFENGRYITEDQARVVHSGSTSHYKVRHADWQHLLHASYMERREDLKSASAFNSLLTGTQLKMWIDTLVARFYKLVDSCVKTVPVSKQCHNTGLDVCSNVNWSSYAPDPKSEIASVDKNTGSLLPRR